MFVEKSDAPFGVAEGHQVLAKQAGAHRLAVSLGKLAFKQKRQPEAPHQLARRRAWPNANEQLVLFMRQHG